MVNLVCRDSSKRAEIITKCSNLFASCVVMDCSEDVNKILILSPREKLAATLLEIGATVRSDDAASLTDEAADQIAFLLSTMSTQ